MKEKRKFSNKEIKENLEGSFKFYVNGWILACFKGNGFQIGFQNGYLMANEIEEIIESLKLYITNVIERDWSFFRKAASEMYLPKLDKEYKAELEGIISGIKAYKKTNLDLIDIAALNGYYDTLSYHYWLKSGEEKFYKSPHCSAFIATGSYTEDNEVIAAHNTWFPYLTGRGYNMIAFISPKRGNMFLMQAYPGTIYSGTDWYINEKGLIVAETTISGACEFNPKGKPYFARIRKAIQYADTIDKFSEIMVKDNNGGYASDWLIGDSKTNEIGCLELGAKNHVLTRTKDGFFAGSNVALTEEVRAETKLDYSDKSSSYLSRRERWLQLIEANKGKINVELAKKFLADHFDTFALKEEPNRNTLCGHIELDSRGWREWECGPYFPFGAFDGKVSSSKLALSLSTWAHWGKPCGASFKADEFINNHPEYKWQSSCLKDILPFPWTLFKPLITFSKLKPF
ncbi:MAG: C45 family peptidase [Candidatus Bathyarchaeia archaeon]